WDLVVDSALPLYLCDVVSLLLAYALITGNQRITEVGYLWGMAGTIQGLITPALRFDGTNIEFYVFFLQHGGVPIAAVFLIWGLSIVPEKGAFKRILYWSWGYMAIVITINSIIGRNYGFLNELPDFASPMDHMGPYPYYLITLQAVAFTLYFILLKVAPKPPEKPLPEISGKTSAQ
ncbi:TIGR02206 family membrane protein, partial [Akkermansiaceae bacterium]|nr:TIGR02206 family membrane protein [Akkermansiaceae bacterium]